MNTALSRLHDFHDSMVTKPVCMLEATLKDEWKHASSVDIHPNFFLLLLINPIILLSAQFGTCDLLQFYVRSHRNFCLCSEQPHHNPPEGTREGVGGAKIRVVVNIQKWEESTYRGEGPKYTEGRVNIQSKNTEGEWSQLRERERGRERGQPTVFALAM